MARRYSRRRSKDNELYTTLGLVGFLILGAAYKLSTTTRTLLIVLVILLVGLIAAAGFFFVMFIAKHERDKLRALTISHVDRMNGHEFEKYVAELLRSQGYSNVSVTKGSGDFGVDIIATKQRIKWAVQAKCYAKPVGNHAISEAVGGKNYYHCTGTMVVTNNTFTAAAHIAASVNGTVLVDRNQLARWILTFQQASDPGKANSA
jgi:restriction system protein